MGAYDDAMVKALTTGHTVYFDNILFKSKGYDPDKKVFRTKHADSGHWLNWRGMTSFCVFRQNTL